MISLTAEIFNDEVISSEIPVFVDFYADWCGPCKMMAPLVEELEKEYEGKVKFAKVNIDEQLLLAQRFRVMSIPTFIVFKGGEAKEVVVGGCSAQSLKEKIEPYI